MVSESGVGFDFGIRIGYRHRVSESLKESESEPGFGNGIGFRVLESSIGIDRNQVPESKFGVGIGIGIGTGFWNRVSRIRNQVSVSGISI